MTEKRQLKIVGMLIDFYQKEIWKGEPSIPQMKDKILEANGLLRRIEVGNDEKAKLETFGPENESAAASVNASDSNDVSRNTV